MTPKNVCFDSIWTICVGYGGSVEFQKLRLHKVRRRLRELPENISPWNFDNRHRSYSIWSILCLCETTDILVFFKKYSANQRMNSELNDQLLRQFVNLKILKRWKFCQNGQAFRVAEMSDSSDNSWETLRKEKSPFFNYNSPSPIIKSYTRKKNPEESKLKVRRRLLDIGNVKSKLRNGCRKKNHSDPLRQNILNLLDFTTEIRISKRVLDKNVEQKNALNWLFLKNSLRQSAWKRMSAQIQLFRFQDQSRPKQSEVTFFHACARVRTARTLSWQWKNGSDFWKVFQLLCKEVSK